MYHYFNILIPRLNLNSCAWYYFDYVSQQILIQYQKGPWPCYAMNPALRIQELIQPDWSLSTGEWIPIKQHSILSDIAMAWPTQSSPISCWHVSEPNTALFFCIDFYECNLYYEDQIDSNKACICFTDMKSDKFPVLRYNLAERTHFTVIKDITVCWYYNRDCQGLKWKTWEFFQGLERQNYTLHWKGRMLQRTRRVKKQQTNLQSIVRRGKTLEGTARQATISEKGKFAWALGASLKRKAFQR